MIKPKRLKRGGTIGVVSPAWWAPEADLWSATEILNAMGFEVDLHDQNMFQNGQIAGTVEERIFAFHELLKDPEIDAIMFARGGYGSCQILDKIDYDLVRESGKPIIGFSDTTMILNAIQMKSKLVTFHGPTLKWLVTNPSDITIGSIFEVFTNENFSQYKELGSSLRLGKGQGRLLGGNFTAINELIGTPYFEPEEDVILFLEDLGEEINDMDKYLWHMKNAGLFDKMNVVGVVLGDMSGLADNKVPFGKSVEEIFLQHFPDIPVVGNVMCGHGESILTFPVGVEVELNVSPNDVSMTLLEPVFSN